MSQFWLFRTCESDDDGDPYEHGVIRAAGRDAAAGFAAGAVFAVMAWIPAFYLYPLVEVADGVLPGEVDPDGGSCRYRVVYNSGRLLCFDRAGGRHVVSYQPPGTVELEEEDITTCSE